MSDAARLLKLARKATAGAAGAPDWGAILKVLAILEASPPSVRACLQAIDGLLRTGGRAARANAVILTDALFKNCGRECLLALQWPPLFRALAIPAIADDPGLHNFLAGSAPAWAESCAAHRCLGPALTAYAQSVCRDLFAPRLTAAVISKLYGDFETALEVLALMAQLLARGAERPDALDWAVVAEILPNVCEIGSRAGELEQIVTDPSVHRLLQILREVSLGCEQGVSDLKKRKLFDAGKLLREIFSGQAVVRARRASPQSDSTRITVRRQRARDDEMPVDDFFKRFDSLKKAATMDSLIDF